MLLSPEQLLALHAALAAEADPTLVGYRTARRADLVAEWLNVPSTFVVWRASVTDADLHAAYVWTELDTLPQAKFNQLTLLLAPRLINPSLSNVRQGLNDIFTGPTFQNTRQALLAAIKRFATRGERMYATGTGSNAAPGMLVVQGPFSESEVTRAWDAGG